jgi:hypothetical protein
MKSSRRIDLRVQYITLDKYPTDVCADIDALIKLRHRGAVVDTTGYLFEISSRHEIALTGGFND